MKEWFGTLARLVVGAVWLVAGLLKISDGAASVRAVRAYDLLPVVELLLGLCLLAGLLTRGSAVLSALLLLAFVAGIASAWARGLVIDCGCFGGGATPGENAAAAYPWDIARDVGLLALSGWLVWRPRTPWSLDQLVFPPDLAAAPEPATREQSR